MNFRVRPVRRLSGECEVPGDKSVSHRAALLGALAEGPTEVQGYLEAEDCLRTLTAIQMMGVEVTRKGPGHYRIAGAGLAGLVEPADVVDCGNSGTTARLLLGVLAGQPFCTTLTGDASLRRRPMKRVVEPLTRMGATVVGRADGAKLPLTVRGAAPLRAMQYATPVASAQVKSAILLAGLRADGPVTVTEPAPSRDHSEVMLRTFGARLERPDARTVTLYPGPLRGAAVQVPGDISSAAFLLVAALVVPDARVTVRRVGVNPTRTGLLDVLAAMGAAPVAAARSADGEPMADLTATSAPLRATTVAGALVPRLIDEVPALAVAAATAHGVTEIRDAAELRVKESDRIAALARELGKMGVRIEERPDGMAIPGGQRVHGARVASDGDHRMAMALAVAALVADGETVIEDTACVATSFPTFVDTVNALAGERAITVEG
ncbi:MAG TPA: 3-phosphoshikimate 1-carboxyvinyltransferase [Methylomirabilota bacterium]|jgi:3-phosphoshikimate 1-carboxyvinyltransferase|nr:3-phosphoshikimate 1-carboxyvinyltransferase [Methylomirabilota bacterium]